MTVIALGTMQHGYCDQDNDSASEATIISGIQKWFAKPENTNLFDGKHRIDPKRLEFWTKSDLSWPCFVQVSPDGRYIFCIQKTGSGDNVAYLFQKVADGTINPAGESNSKRWFSHEAWTYFRKETGLAANLYHDGVEFVAWGDDHQSVEFSLHGRDGFEEYYISDWLLHYNISTHKFYVARGQRKQNREAIVFKHRKAKQ